MGLLDAFKKASKEMDKTTGAAGGAVTAGGPEETATTESAAALGLPAEFRSLGKLFGDSGEKLSGVLDKLQASGLDDKLKSWIGLGDNEPVTGDQVTAALGAEEVGEVAQEMGVSSAEAASKIADLLPKAIDKLTPDGLVPDPDALAKKLTGFFK